MANEAKKNNKGIIIGICCAVVVVVAIVIAAVLANQNQLGDSYFKSDDTKYVLTIESDELASEDGEYTPVKTHMVYTYKDDTITSLKTYAEYADAATAKKAFDAMKESGADMANYELNGKYIIETAPADQYEGVTASDVKSQIEFYESLKNMTLDESTSDEETETVEGETVEVTNEEGVVEEVTE